MHTPLLLLSSFFLFLSGPFSSKPERIHGRHLPSGPGRWAAVGVGYPGGTASPHSWQACLHSTAPWWQGAGPAWRRGVVGLGQDLRAPEFEKCGHEGRRPDTGRWILSRVWRAASWRGGLAYQDTEQTDTVLGGNSSQASLRQRRRATNRERIWKWTLLASRSGDTSGAISMPHT